MLTVDQFKQVEAGDLVESGCVFQGLSFEQLTWTVYQGKIDDTLKKFECRYFGVWVGKWAGKLDGKKIIWMEE